MAIQWTAPVIAIAAGIGIFFLMKQKLLGLNPKMLGAILVIGGLVFGGYLSGFNLANVNQQDVSGSVGTLTLSAGTVNASATGIAVNTMNKHEFDVTATDAVTIEDIYVNGTVTVLRVGSAGAMFMPVSCNSDDYKNPSDVTDTVVYNIVSKDTAGELECYVNGAQGASTLGFVEGTASATALLAWKWSEAGHDKTIQYDSRVVSYDIGGQEVLFKVTRLEAAS